MLEYEITELIKKNLPSATAGVLNEYIEEAEERKEELEKAKDQLIITDKTLSSVIGERDKLINQKKSVEVAEIDVSKREEVVGDFEKRLELKQMKLECAGEKVALVKEMFGMVFRNTTVRNTVLKSTSHVVKEAETYSDSPAPGEHIESAVDTEDTTKTEE